MLTVFVETLTLDLSSLQTVSSLPRLLTHTPLLLTITGAASSGALVLSKAPEEDVAAESRIFGPPPDVLEALARGEASDAWKLDQWIDAGSFPRPPASEPPIACLRLQIPIPLVAGTPSWAPPCVPDHAHADSRVSLWHAHPAIGDHDGTTGVIPFPDHKLSYLATYNIIPRSCYVFRVRGVNTVGVGEWSAPSISVKTMKTAPLPPGKVMLKGCTATLLSLYWAPSRPNGFPVTRYLLQVRPHREPRHNHIARAEERAKCVDDDWVTYRDDLVETFCLVSDLTHGAGYVFRAKGLNEMGWSLWSPESDVIYTTRLLS